jgi:hypothetical protein
MTTAYKAAGKAGHVTRATPRDAATAYFESFPTSRKCDVQEGKREGGMFTVSFTLTDKATWPARWENITKKTVASLPAFNKEDARP